MIHNGNAIHVIIDGEWHFMSELKTDSKKKSASEALVNSFGGYPIGYGLGIVVLPLSTGWIQDDPYMANQQLEHIQKKLHFYKELSS